MIMKQNKKIIKKMRAIALASTLFVSGLPNPHLAQAATTFSIPSQVTIGKGETFQLNVKGTSSKPTFRSSNKKVVSVTKSGKIKGNKIGKATITAKINKKTKRCKVTVKAAPKKISFSQSALTLFPGDTKKLSVKISSGYSKKITYQTTDTTVASVSANGLVTAKATGETTITAKTFNGKTATLRCVVASNSTPVATTQVTTPTMPATSPAITGTPLQTANAATSTPAVSNIPNASLAPTQAGNTATPATTCSTSTQETAVPTDTPNTQTPLAPTNTPESSAHPATEQPTCAPTQTPTATPATTPVASATATPSAIVSASPIPTATPIPTEAPTVTYSAAISKIENGTIYIENNLIKLQLTSCITYYKNCFDGTKYQITKEELLPGDFIEITTSGVISNTYPVSTLADCEQIIVTHSIADAIIEDKISKIEDNRTLKIANHPNTEFHLVTDTKIYKNGEEITRNELQIGDVVRVCARNPYLKDSTYSPSMNSYNGWARTIVVLGDSVDNLDTTQEFFTYKEDATSPDETWYKEIWHTDMDSYYIANDTLLEITNLDGSITYKPAIGQLPPMTTLTIYYEEVIAEEAGAVPYKRAVRICYTQEQEDPFSTIAKKPVIYLYPEEKTDVSVDLDFNGNLSYTYPYTTDGHWEVTADTDGTLTNKADGLEYSYIFWEGVTDQFTADFSQGFCVKGKDSTKFLQTILPKMGLTPKEYNEFIVYWAPLMEENEYNLISFQTKNYEQNAPLHINPAPDSMLRVYMAYKPLTSPVDIEPQTFEPFKREGFTVVEWGGCVVPD